MKRREEKSKGDIDSQQTSATVLNTCPGVCGENLEVEMNESFPIILMMRGEEMFVGGSNEAKLSLNSPALKMCFEHRPPV